jgi:hypothetical protein
MGNIGVERHSQSMLTWAALAHAVELSYRYLKDIFEGQESPIAIWY